MSKFRNILKAIMASTMQKTVQEQKLKIVSMIEKIGKYDELDYAPVYALDLKTGKKIWKFNAEESVWGLSI